MWPDLPLEFNVVGTPVSLQASRASKTQWMSEVLKAAIRKTGRDRWAFDEQRLGVTLFYFPQTMMEGDLDNILKVTLDALKPNIYVDDKLVDRIVVQRFDPLQSFSFNDVSETLAQALASTDPVLYIKLTDVQLEEISI